MTTRSRQQPRGRWLTSVDAAATAIESAKAAGLRYVSDSADGIRRRRAGGGFSYVGPDGTRLTDPEALGRIRALAIPPAWRDVWICPLPHGHLQAVGRDARGRKQYRYHSRWRAVRDATKYARLLAFGETLPRIRDRVDRDLALPALPRDKVLATLVRLLETTCIRVGNEAYAKTNASFGLTTLRGRHVEVSGSTLRFEFRGKGGKPVCVDVTDRRLARIVKRCQELPGQELFQYIDADGARQTIDSGDVNAYLKEISGEEFTAKDFRTWAGTGLATLALQRFERCDSQTQAKRNVLRAVEAVARHLGNTAAICRKSYVHPAVIDTYLAGRRLPALRKLPARRAGLRPEEAAVLALLRSCAERDARSALQRVA